MSEYNLFAGVNADYEFPPEVRAALLESLNIRNVGAPMTTNQRNALNTADLDPGYYIFNTQTQTFQIWRADFEEWHDGLEAPGSQKWWPGPVIPAGWRKQDGASLPRAKYFALFDAIKTTYGGAATPTHFQLPNTLGRMPVDVGGEFLLNSLGGASKVKLLATHMPKHAHAGTTNDTGLTHSHTGNTGGAGTHNHGYWWVTTGEFNATGNGPAANGVYRAARTFTNTDDDGWHGHAFTTDDTYQAHSHPFATDERGGDTEHENMPPFVGGHFIIKY